MDGKVIDASAAAALLPDEPEGAALLSQIVGAQLFAPTFWHLELANVCRTKSKRHPETEARNINDFRRRGRLRVETCDTDAEEARDAALRADLSVYDAAYLALARSLGLELVTLDKRLARAAASL